MAGVWLLCRKDALKALLEVVQIGMYGRVDGQPEVEFLIPTDGMKVWHAVTNS